MSQKVTDYTTHRAIEAVAWYFANREGVGPFSVDAEWDDAEEHFRIVVSRESRWADAILPGYIRPGYDLTARGHATMAWIEDITGRAIARWNNPERASCR